MMQISEEIKGQDVEMEIIDSDNSILRDLNARKAARE
jgi:hypothetical protein